MSIYDSYDLYQMIGHGATCTVKRAVRKQNQQVFAAKLYQSDLLTAKNQIQMLIRLDHPNIVNIYQIFQDENCIFLILEYMQGGQLYQSIAQKHKLTQYIIMQYMKTLFDAVRYCHQINVVHRDIKPQNLLLSTHGPDGILKLADFGISKILSDQLLRTNCGTPIYMAPQIWKGHAYDSKVDVWSIGVVMYYLLSGAHPFKGDEDTLGDHIMFEELKFEDKVWNSISSKAIDLLKKLLQKDPAKRPSALQATNHIWFTSHLSPPSPITQDESNQITLYRNMNKIKRFNFKRKLKRSKRKMQSLSQQTQKIRYPHLQFILKNQSQNYQMDYQLQQPQNKIPLNNNNNSKIMQAQSFKQI